MDYIQELMNSMQKLGESLSTVIDRVVELEKEIKELKEKAE